MVCYDQTCQKTLILFNLFIKLQELFYSIFLKEAGLNHSLDTSKEQPNSSGKYNINAEAYFLSESIFVWRWYLYKSGVVSFIKSHMALSLQTVSALSSVLPMFCLKEFLYSSTSWSFILSVTVSFLMSIHPCNLWPNFQLVLKIILLYIYLLLNSHHHCCQLSDTFLLLQNTSSL